MLRLPLCVDDFRIKCALCYVFIITHMQSLLSAGVSWLYTEFTLFSRWVMSTHMLDTLSPLWHKIRLWATNSPLGQTRLWATKLASVASAFMAEKNTRLYGTRLKTK